MSGAMLPDFTEVLQDHQAARPRKQNPANGTRRETILSLVEMLLQSDEVAKRKEQRPSPEADKDFPSVDEHLQDTGAEGFNKFSRRMSNFDRELRNFANAARQLGSSVAILSSAFHLRERLAQILFLYRENAATLFPRKISRAPKESLINEQARCRRGRRWRTKAPSHIVQPIVNEDIDVEDFPNQMELFAKEISTFLHCLNEFPEFTDEAVNASILSFERDLQYWASCLKEYNGQFRNPAVQRYLHDLSIEMGEHIDGITSTLSIFIEVGVPIIRFAQKHGATNLLNLSTVATFFSAVTATTLQFSYELGRGGLSDAVNSFWFASLVFSIAAAVNSLLGLTWKQAMYRSPGDRVPWWVLIWIKRSPLVFLVMSVACFSIGLCFFAYASHQAPVTSTITTVLTALTSFGLCAVSAWFATERWIFMRYRGKKWLDDVLMEITDTLLQNRVIDICRQGLDKTGSGLERTGALIKYSGVVIKDRVQKLFTSCSCIRKGSVNDSKSSILPVTNEYPSRPINPINEHEVAHPFTHKSLETVLTPIQTTGFGSPSLRSPSITSQEKSPVCEIPPPFPVTAATSIGKQRWQNAYRAIKSRAAINDPETPVVGTAREPLRRRTNSSNQIEKKRTGTPMKGARTRVAGLIPKLKVLEATQDLAAHVALVKHLQFSPDGKYLATSGWDHTSVIFKVGDPFVSHRILAHVKSFVGQVAWSPDGKYLLTKMNKGMKVWTEDGVCINTIERDEPVEAITWCNRDEKFLSVTGSVVYQLDIDGNECAEYHLGAIKIHDVAVTPDDRRALAVGPLLQSPSGLHPSKSRAEKRLIVFNLELDVIECQVPVLNDVRDITLVEPHRGDYFEAHRNEFIVLISYENKAPPQLWKLEILKDRDTGKESSRLTLRHTFMLKSNVDFAGPSYFGGQRNELVLCAGKNGEIFIWDTQSGALLHHIKAQADGGDLTCIAWNQAATDPFMFASGCHDGTVRIWTKPPNTPELDDVAQGIFTFGELSRSTSPHDDFESSESGRQSPELQLPKLKSRGISFVSSNSSDSSMLRMGR